MQYLFFQIWIWLLVSFALGWVAHWFFCCRKQADELGDNNEADKPNVRQTDNNNLATVDANWKPQGLTNPPETGADDLKRIKGIGSVLEDTLNKLGIYYFDQITQWSNENIVWIEDFLAFPGRINREEWLNQAKTLSEGGTTEFANRVDKGDVEYE